MATKKGKRQVRYIIILVLIIVLILLAVFSYTLDNEREMNPVESLLKDTVVQIQKIVYFPFKYLGGLGTEFKELLTVKKENDILKEKVERIDYLETENIELKKQLEEIKEELNLDYTLVDYEYLNATVVSRNTNYWFNNLTIDKGSHNGVEVGMVVVNSSGLIGKITSVTTFTSEVRLLTTSDTNNKISVTITNGENNKVNGLIYGYDYENNILQVEGVSNTETVNVGDLVYTSGLGGVFPKGILIGKVDNISVDSYGLAKIINVKPSGDFSDINYVTVLKRKES